MQRSGFPDRYAPREAQAESIVATLRAGPDNPAPPSDGGTPPSIDAAASCPDNGKSDLPLEPGQQQQPGRLPEDFPWPADPQQKAAVQFAAAQLGKRYVWGGKGPDDYDCSGLMLAAWAAAGVGIPAGTVAQGQAGHAVAGLSQAQPGDLLFIPGAFGSATTPRHVGMYIGADLIVDAYDEHHGVILERVADWSTRIVKIRRVVEPAVPAPPRGGGR
ncbi:hypothetical protein GCM10022222_51160 [Amycolatopsis ultiminotia]|uniref:NlpC/P60 domain-containing protein n=1 Tax=Amycolatopsis ultiminotia TaxID=543629 RepID=A0ABP6X451_9PSEU